MYVVGRSPTQAIIPTADDLHTQILEQEVRECLLRIVCQSGRPALFGNCDPDRELVPGRLTVVANLSGSLSPSQNKTLIFNFIKIEIKMNNL